MGNFIYRDYSGPKIADYTRKAKLLNLFKQLGEKAIVDGVEVYKSQTIPLYIKGKGILSKKNDGRDDADPQTIHRNKLYRFLRALGTKDKDLKKKKFKDIEKGYLYISRARFALNTYDMTKAQIATKLQEFFSAYALAPTTTANTIELPTKSNAGDWLGKVVSPNALYTSRYTFEVAGVESTVSNDTNFIMQADGSVYFTVEGKLADFDKYGFDLLSAAYNTGTYTVRAYNTTGQYITFTMTMNKVIREFTLDHSYQPNNGMMIDGNPQSLVDLLAIIEPKKLEYYGNVRYNGKFTAYIVNELDAKLNVTEGYKFTPVLFTNVDNKYGYLLESLAALDNGTTFQLVAQENAYQFVTDVSYHDGDIHTTATPVLLPTINWTNRYKRIADITETSYIVDQIYELFRLMKKSARKEDKMDNDEFDVLIKEAAGELMGVDLDISDMFYKKYLRVDAIDGIPDGNGGWIKPPIGVHDFAKLLEAGLKFGYVAEKGDFWDKVIAVVIVVVAIVIAVVVFLFTGDIALALSCAQLWLTVASMVYAKHVGDAWGMRLIGRAIEINGMAMAVVAIFNAAQAGYNLATEAAAAEAANQSVNAMASTAAQEAGDAIVNEVYKAAAIEIGKQVVIGAVNIAALGAYMGHSMGSFGKYAGYASMAVNMAEGISNLGASIKQGYSKSLMEGLKESASQFKLEPLESTVFRDISGGAKLLYNSFTAYSNASAQNSPSNNLESSQADKQGDGANPLYTLKTHLESYDALQHLQTMIDSSVGGYRTELTLLKNTQI